MSKLAFLLALILITPLSHADEDGDDPDFFDIKVELGSIRGLHHGEHYNTKGFASQHLQIYGAKTLVSLDSSLGHSEHARHMWMSLGSRQQLNDLLSKCQEHGLDGLKDASAKVVIMASQVPYDAVMKDPADYRSAKLHERKAQRDEASAKANYKRAKADYAAILPQIAKFEADAKASTAKKKDAFIKQAANLRARAILQMSNAEKAYAKALAQVQALRDKAAEHRAKIEARSAELQKRSDALAEDIADLVAKIAKHNEKGNSLQAERATIAKQFKIDQKERVDSELDDTKPGVRRHLSVNVDKFKVSCD